MIYKWPIPDINGISYLSNISIYVQDNLIAQFYPQHGLQLGKDPDNGSTWVFVEDPPAGDYSLYVETGEGEVLVQENGTFEGEQILPDPLPPITWKHEYSGDTEWVDVRTAVKRLEICKQCPRNQDNVCLDCGCFIPLKTKKASDYCPLHKW